MPSDIHTNPEELAERRKTFGPEPSRQLIHELRVHQIELEMQNEELRRTQAELDAARARYFDLYNIAPVGYCTVSESERILEANLTAAKLLGVPSSELVQKPIKQFIVPADQDIYYLHRKLLFETGQPQSCELRLLKKNGAPFWAELTATHALDAAGAASHRLVLTDISDRKRLDKALHAKNIELQRATIVAEKANLAKSDFLSSMSHELRSPLNAILGFAQLLESGKPPPTALQFKNIEKILDGGWYLLALINEILDLALIESGKLSLSLQPLLLTRVWQECQNMVESQAQQKGIHVHFPPVTDPLQVIADPMRLRQVVVNLLSNAIKYNRVDGVVDVRVRTTSEGLVRISVQDSGEGLSEEKLAQLFQPFNRLGQERSQTQGTGIGLVVTRRLIELMGGNIGVESTVGEGSVFWVDLCIAQSKPVSIDMDPSSNGLHDPAAALGEPVRTVLYVEDNLVNMELVEQILSVRPHIQLLKAHTGTQGLAMARQCSPHVILLDINLPGLSGVEVMEILRTDPTTCHIPVMAISANAMPLDVVKGLSMGFFRYLTKPFKIDEFLAALDLALAITPGTPTSTSTPPRL